MIRRYVLPVLAVVGLAFAIWTAIQGAKIQPPSKPVSDPPRSPYRKQNLRFRNRRGEHAQYFDWIACPGHCRQGFCHGGEKSEARRPVVYPG